MKYKSVLLLFFILLSLVLPSAVIGQGNDEAGELRTLVHKNEGQIEKWERTATVAITLNVIVGVLGVVVAGLQKSDSGWAKGSTIIIGIVIGSLTCVLNFAFPVDYRQLRRQAIEARLIVTDLELKIAAGIPQDESNHRVWYEEFKNQLHKVIEMGKEPDKRAANKGIVPTVFAQSIGRKPEWVSKLPDDPGNLYFLGVGDDPSLEKAREVSHDNAVSRAEEYLSGQFLNAQQANQPLLDSARLSEYVVKSAENAGIYFEYDPKGHSYRYYTLLRIHKDVAETDLKLYGLQVKRAMPQRINAVVQTAPGLSKAFSAAPFAYVVGDYRIGQQHLKLMEVESGKIGVYVGDVHQNSPVQILIFKADRIRTFSEKQRTNFLSLKRSLKADEILLEREVVNRERVRVKPGVQELLFEFKYVWSGLGEKYAEVTVKSSSK